MFTGIVAGTAPIVQIEDKDVIRSLTVDLEEYTSWGESNNGTKILFSNGYKRVN